MINDGPRFGKTLRKMSLEKFSLIILSGYDKVWNLIQNKVWAFHEALDLYHFTARGDFNLSIIVFRLQLT